MVASGRHRFSALLVIQELNLSYGYIHVPYTGPCRPQRPLPSGFEVLDDDLELAALRVKADPPAQQHLRAIRRPHPAVTIAVDEHGATHLRPVVLQREVPMPGAGPPEVGQLPADPNQIEVPLKQQPDLLVEAADR